MGLLGSLTGVLLFISLLDYETLAYFACYNIGHARIDEGKYPQVPEWKQNWLNQRNMLKGEDQRKSFRENINKIRAIMLSQYYVPRIAPHG